MRLLLFSGLEGQDLLEMFFQNHVRPFLEFLTSYIARRIEDGAFWPVPPLLAARSFMGMLVHHRLLTHLSHLSAPHSSTEIVSTFVVVFLNGVQRQANLPGRSGQRRRRKCVKSESKSPL